MVPGDVPAVAMADGAFREDRRPAARRLSCSGSSTPVGDEPTLRGVLRRETEYLHIRFPGFGGGELCSGSDFMIPYAEKLSFLMHIANISNKELAGRLDVDPSLISLMRTGKRKLPRNPAFARRMATVLAERCPAAYQRQALSDMLGQVSINPGMPLEVLAERLRCWLLGEQENLADTILTGIQTLPNPMERTYTPATEAVHAEQTQFFYGESGRREAMTHMMEQMRQMDTPGTVLTVVDDNLEWLLSDYLLTRRIQSGFLELLDRGFTFCQIMPPLNYINRYTESLQFWLPIYATGKTRVYYYPRLRGNLYRHSIIVVPGRCVQYSASVGLGSTSDVTMFSTDPQMVGAMEKQFNEHLALCKPSLNVHRDYRDFATAYAEFFSRKGDVAQEVNSLSLNSMPRELLERCMQDSAAVVWEEGFQAHLEEIPRFEARLQEQVFIDMCCLATAQEVRAGTLPVVALSSDYPGQFYIPETYCMHLKNILRLMEKYENYCFVPLEKKECADFNLFVSEGGMALVVRTIEPFIMLDIRRPQMIVALQEHLLRRADSKSYRGIEREKTRMTLRALIQELED